jgi:hypothetical protein
MPWGLLLQGRDTADTQAWRHDTRYGGRCCSQEQDTAGKDTPKLETCTNGQSQRYIPRTQLSIAAASSRVGDTRYTARLQRWPGSAESCAEVLQLAAEPIILQNMKTLRGGLLMLLGML